MELVKTNVLTLDASDVCLSLSQPLLILVSMHSLCGYMCVWCCIFFIKYLPVQKEKCAALQYIPHPLHQMPNCHMLHAETHLPLTVQLWLRLCTGNAH